MKFLSVDGEIKRVAHTSGVIEMIGKTPIDLPIYDPETGKGYKGLKECAMAAGCVPYTEEANTETAQSESDKKAAEKAAFDKAVEDAVAAKLAEAKAAETTSTDAPSVGQLEKLSANTENQSAPAKGKVIKG